MTIEQLVAALAEFPPETPVHLYLDDDPNVPEGTVAVMGVDPYEGCVVLVGDYPTTGAP